MKYIYLIEDFFSECSHISVDEIEMPKRWRPRDGKQTWKYAPLWLLESGKLRPALTQEWLKLKWSYHRQKDSGVAQTLINCQGEFKIA